MNNIPHTLIKETTLFNVVPLLFYVVFLLLYVVSLRFYNNIV